MTYAPPKRDKAGAQPGEVGTAQNTNPKPNKKIYRVEAELKQPRGMNRFEAERIGDHCLNSTVADLRKTYGDKLIQRWERVPSRFNPDGVRVCRYWIVGGAV